MPENKLLYKNMTIEELIVLSQNEDYKALESLIRKIQSRSLCNSQLSAKNKREPLGFNSGGTIKSRKKYNLFKKSKLL